MISKAAAGLSQLCQISPTHIIFADFEVVVKCNVCVCTLGFTTGLAGCGRLENVRISTTDTHEKV
jgi:hypothetical protein